RLNLRWGLPLPDGAARYVYSAHLLEHLYYEDAKTLLADLRRVLRPDGVLRLVVPDVGACLAAYARQDRTFYERRKDSWPDTASDATPIAQILSYAGAGAAPGDLGAHKFGYDFETLTKLLHGAGFTSVERSTFNGSRHPALRIDDASAVAGFAIDGVFLSLFVEATP